MAGPGWNRFIISSVVVLLIAVSIVIFMTIRLTHRVCGPVYRIMQTLESWKKGESVYIRLRDGDAFPELAQSLNETYDILRQGVGVGVESSAEGDS